MNRREHKRFPCRRRVEIEFDDTGLLDEGSCLDVSETGMLLLVSSGVYEDGDVITVRFPGDQLQAAVKVVWLEPVEDEERLQHVGVVALAALDTDPTGRPSLAAHGIRPAGSEDSANRAVA